MAWAGLAVGGPLPWIVWQALTGEPPPAWIAGAQAVALGAMLLVVLRRPRWRDVRGLLLALVAMQVGLLIVALLRSVPPYEPWATGASEYEIVFAGAFLMLIPGVLMVLTATADGLGRRDLFLQPGDPAAASRIPGARRKISWRVLGPLLVALFALPLAAQLALVNDPDPDGLGQAAALLPLALVFGAVNALNEEVRFRCVLLARLGPVVGAETAIWMTALNFGLAHWYGGTPSGPSGAAMTMVAGLAWAKSIVETRGLFWAWTMHGAMDVVIFTFLVLAAS